MSGVHTEARPVVVTGGANDIGAAGTPLAVTMATAQPEAGEGGGHGS